MSDDVEECVLFALEQAGSKSFLGAALDTSARRIKELCLSIQETYVIQLQRTCILGRN